MCTDVLVLNRFNIGSDHILVRTISVDTHKERKKLIEEKLRPTRTELEGKQEEFTRQIEQRLEPTGALKDLELNELTSKIGDSIRVATKRDCTVDKRRNSKLTPAMIGLIEERRVTDRDAPGYRQMDIRLIKDVIKANRRDLRAHMIHEVIENNRNMKVLRFRTSSGKQLLHRMRNELGVVVTDKGEILAVIEGFYRKLYSPPVPHPEYQRRVIQNVGSEEIAEINMLELRAALKQMKNRKAPGEDQVTGEMLKTGEETLYKALFILLNKCLEEERIPNAWSDAEVTILLKKGASTNIENYRSLWKSLTSLDLSYNQLDSVPFVALKELRSLQWINLHGNQVSSISGEWSHMKNTVATLFLGENDITEIPNETSDHISKNQHGLRQFKSLIWLNLDGNRIYKIHKHSLPLTLQTASISHNLIENFPLDIIATLPHLQWLYLRGNHIKAIPEHTFARKLWLEKIDLGENYLKTLPRCPFNNSVYIRDLNLAFNDFRTLAKESFTGLQTGRIILSYNLLENIDINAFAGIDESLEYLDFDHNNFQHIPQAVSQLKSLKYLYLSSNSLSEIPDGAFENFCHSLKALSLSGNHLTRIPSETLQNCTKISHFNIAFNEIYDINENDFSNWGYNIKSLIMGNNRITSLKSQIFADLQELKELSLSFNPLRIIDTDAFVGLDGLESLEISFGLDRDDLPHEIFKPLTNLKWLSVDHNNFHMVSELSLDSLPELKYLNIESNKIRSIPIKLLKSNIHAKLKDIRLSNNELTFIETGTFRSLNSLETILLSGNKIKYIQSESFIDLPNLNKLILSNNFLSRISHGSFSNLPSLSKLDLQNNLISEISFGYFTNISSPLLLNLSRNQISSCNSDSKILSVEVLDLRYNNLIRIPRCLEHTALLKKLYLDFNIINSLEHNSFMHLTSLEHLSLQQNNIMVVSRKAFFGLQNLQVLDLSKNLISQLHTSQFANMPKLRILDLSGNSLNYLPKDIFSNTLLEMLDLSYNLFAVVPSLSISDVGITLRHLSMRSNNIEHIDITTFPDIPSLQRLDLSNNKLTILPDNVFTSLGLLQTLDLSSNPLRANFKELFHYAQSLKHLNLANSGITSTPHLPLPNLVHLNLSHNHIEAINKNSVQELSKLKSLDLSHNDLFQVPSHLWIHLPNLKVLDLSYNPIKDIVADNFYGLQNLQELNIQHLKYLNRFESKSILQLKILSSLSMQTWPKIDHFSDQFCHLLSHLDQLRILKIHFTEIKLDDQLLCVTNRKIRHLEITGRNLKFIDKDAFATFIRNPDLVLKIRGTQIEELPSGLFSNMYKISYLTIDLRYNALSYLNPEIFYGNSTTWKNVGTTLISGGLSISDNPFRCGCHLAWLGHWLRRWTRESFQSHNAPVETALRMHEMVKEAMCVDVTTGIRIPIVQLPPEDMSCHASALSAASNLNKNSVMFVLLLFVVNFVHSYILI